MRWCDEPADSCQTVRTGSDQTSWFLPLRLSTARPPAVRCPAASRFAAQQEGSREAETPPDRRDVCRCDETPFAELCRELEETKGELQSLKIQKVSQSGAETFSKERNPNAQEKVTAGPWPDELLGSHGEGS